MRFTPQGPPLFEEYIRHGDPEVFSPLIAETNRRAQARKWLSDDERQDLTVLVNVLTARHHEDQDGNALGVAIQLADAMDAAAKDYPLRPVLRAQQAVRYKDLYVMTGVFGYLEQAIALCEDQVAQAPAGSYLWSVPAANLAAYLNRRFAHAGRIGDLNRAMELNREVLKQPRDEANHAGQTMNLGLMYFTRWQFLGRPADLETAIATMEPVARTAPVPAQAKLGFFLDLATCLVARARAGLSAGEQAAADLDEADRLIATAYANSPFGSVIKALSCGARATLIGARLPERTTVAAIDEDIELLEFCAALAGSHQRVEADVRAALAPARAARFTLGGEDTDLDAATEAFAEICRSARDPVEKFSEALAWARWAERLERWDSAAQAFRQLLPAVHDLSAGQFGREHQELWLSQAPYLADQAAFALAASGDADGALEAAETGRALLLRRALAERNETDALREAGHADLADTLHQAWTLYMIAARGGSEEDVRLTGEQYQRLLAEARVLVPGPGTAGAAPSGAAPSGAEIKATAARSGTCLVYICVSPHGGVALVVSGHEPVRLVQLPDLTLDRVAEQAQSLYSAYARHRVRPTQTSAWMDALNAVGDWSRREIWHAVWPVIDAVAPAGTTVTLLPGGPLRFVPIHAAHHPADGSASAARHLIDLRPLSYAPSAAALVRHDSVPARFTDAAEALIVHDPAADGPPLIYATAEAAAVRRRLPDAVVLTGAAATRAAVGDRLRTAALVHLACHGVADPMSPLTSGIELADGRLTVQDLLAQRAEHRGVCVLSACETAVSGAALPNEVVGLPTALLQAGFGTVLATQWVVDDISIALLMARFYDETQAEPNGGLAAALSRAQVWLRDADNEAKAALLPEYGQAAAALSPVARRLWGQARVHGHPYHWAALTVHGAVSGLT